MNSCSPHHISTCRVTSNTRCDFRGILWYLHNVERAGAISTLAQERHDSLGAAFNITEHSVGHPARRHCYDVSIIPMRHARVSPTTAQTLHRCTPCADNVLKMREPWQVTQLSWQRLQRWRATHIQPSKVQATGRHGRHVVGRGAWQSQIQKVRKPRRQMLNNGTSPSPSPRVRSDTRRPRCRSRTRWECQRRRERPDASHKAVVHGYAWLHHQVQPR